MGAVTRTIPKPMIHIGNKPILEHQVELLKKYQITDIIILVNHLKQSIVDYFGDGTRWGVNITYYEEPEPLGTVGGIKEIENLITGDFIVFYGDVMVNMNLSRLIDFHRQQKSEATLVLHPNDHPYDSDLVELDSAGRITAFHPKPHIPGVYYRNLVNAGVYIFSKNIMQHLEKGRKADFGHDVFPAVHNKLNMFGYNTAEYLKDMGTPERLEQVNRDYTSGTVNRANYDYKQQAIFLDRDGVINFEKSFIHTPEDFQLYPFTSGAIKAINQSGYKAIVITNQSVIARNMCTLDELDTIHKKLETELGTNHAKIDALFFCPHHPDRGYPEERTEYKIDCICRKPKPGMLFEAAEAFNIDLAQSFMIGDSERDILAGKNAGCYTVGVMTGYGVKESSVQPDFFFTDLDEAVQFITANPYSALMKKLNQVLMGSPAIVAIGGNARCGKSNLASWISRSVALAGKKVLTVRLDHWILPEPKRTDAMNVFDRFQLEKIEADIQSLLGGNILRFKPYNNHQERQLDAIEYNYQGEDVIIIEGVVALQSEVLRNLAHAKIFMPIEQGEHKRRLHQYYTWKGKNNDEIEILIRRRKKDEYQLIEKAIKFADFVIKN
jgi:D,D-heptose 1,7-bisphosphate phosphatase